MFSQDVFASDSEFLAGHDIEQLLAHQNHLLVTLFFNLAICQHTHGMRHCQSSDLVAALKLCELVFSIIDMTSSMSDFGWGDQQMILLAIYNNMGHIHATFCNAHETQLCVDIVKRIFLARPNHHYHQQQQQQQQQQQEQEQSAKESHCLLEPSDYQFFTQYLPINAYEQCNVASAA